MTEWPFSNWHKLALRQFGLTPEAFWTMPLCDWLSLLAPENHALDRGTLNGLMKDYPDE